MSVYLAIAIGGCFGAMSRYWVSTNTNNWLGTDFPYGTLMVNVIGSIVVGFLSILLVERINVSEEIRLGLLIGFLGSFTTFSTFALDTIYWIDSGAIVKALLYVLLSVICSILGVWAGLIAAKQLL